MLIGTQPSARTADLVVRPLTHGGPTTPRRRWTSWIFAAYGVLTMIVGIAFIGGGIHARTEALWAVGAFALAATAGNVLDVRDLLVGVRGDYLALCDRAARRGQPAAAGIAGATLRPVHPGRRRRPPHGQEHRSGFGGVPGARDVERRRGLVRAASRWRGVLRGPAAGEAARVGACR